MVEGTLTKVKDIRELSAYSNHVKQFTKTYHDACNHARHSFTMKTMNQEGEVISAFLKKLEDIQTTIFDKYPELLEQIGTTYQNYEKELTSLGFQDIVWSNYVNSAMLSYRITTTNQYDSPGRLCQMFQVYEASDELNKLFDQVRKEGVAIGTNLTQGIVESAQDNFNKAGNKRTTKAQQVDAATQKFIKELDDRLTELANMQALINSARNMTTLPLDEIKEAIHNGTLSADEMYYFDNMADNDNLKVIQSLIEGKTEDLATVNPDKVTAETYRIMAREMSQWAYQMKYGENKEAKSAAVKKYNDFFQACTNESSEKIQKLANGIMIGATQNGALLELQMGLLYDKCGGNVPIETVDEMKRQLNSVNDLAGYMMAMQVFKVGTEKESVEHGTYGPTLYTKLQNFMCIDGDEIHYKSDVFDIIVTYNKEKSGEWVPTYIEGQHQTIKSETLTQDFANDYNNQELKELSKKILDLNKQKAEAYQDFMSNISTALVNGTLEAIAPEAYPLISLAMDIFSSSGEWDTGGKVAKAGYDELSKRYSSLNDSGKKSLVDGLTSIATAYQNYLNKINKIDLEKDETSKRMLNNILNQGGWGLKNTHTHHTEYTDNSFYMNFETYLRLRELDKFGLISYIEMCHKNQSDNSEVQEIKEVIVKNTSDLEVRNYLLGNSNKSLTDFTADQLEELWSTIEEVQKKCNKNLNTYFTKRYEGYNNRE